MTIQIKDFTVGTALDQPFLIKGATIGTASNNSTFISLTLCDKSGEIGAKFWDASEHDINMYKPGEIIHVAGNVSEFKGTLQVNLRQIYIVTDTHNASDYVRSAPVSQADLVQSIGAYANSIKNDTLRTITVSIVNKYQEKFFTYPAAKSAHHDMMHGLLYHTDSMLKLADGIIRLHPTLNTDLIYAGIILHDICKTKELSDPVTPEYTVEGNLIGHISMIAEEVAIQAHTLNVADKEEVLLLKHVLLSHHGKLEFGSPKQPIIKEAEVIHMIDMLDAKLNTIDKAYAATEPGEFTERLWAMDNRSFYKPTI